MTLDDLQKMTVDELIVLMEKEDALCYGDNWYLSVMSLSSGQQAEKWKRKFLEVGVESPFLEKLLAN